jgi:hypothetical protein
MLHLSKNREGFVFVDIGTKEGVAPVRLPTGHDASGDTAIMAGGVVAAVCAAGFIRLI